MGHYCDSSTHHLPVFTNVCELTDAETSWATHFNGYFSKAKTKVKEKQVLQKCNAISMAQEEVGFKFEAEPACINEQRTYHEDPEQGIVGEMVPQ